jgi:hypothetical protein
MSLKYVKSDLECFRTTCLHCAESRQELLALLGGSKLVNHTSNHT